MGLSTENEPIVRVVKLSQMLDHEMYQRIRLNFFRLRCQFVSGNDRRTSYDYFMLTCGPVSAKSQTLAPDGALSMIGDDGAAYCRRAAGRKRAANYFPAQNSQGFCRRQNLRKAGNLQNRTNFWVDANPFGLSSRRRGSCEGPDADPASAVPSYLKIFEKAVDGWARISLIYKNETR